MLPSDKRSPFIHSRSSSGCGLMLDQYSWHKASGRCRGELPISCSTPGRGSWVWVLEMDISQPNCHLLLLQTSWEKSWIFESLWDFNLTIVSAGSQNVSFCLSLVTSYCELTYIEFFRYESFCLSYQKVWHFYVSTFIIFCFVFVAFCTFIKEYDRNNLNFLQ